MNAADYLKEGENMALDGYTVTVTVEDFTKPHDDKPCTTITYETHCYDCFRAMRTLLQWAIADYGDCPDCWFFIHVMQDDTECGVVDDRMFGAINGTRGR